MDSRELLHRGVVAIALLLVALAVGTIPGASSRRVVEPRTLMLPASPGGSAIDVVVRAEASKAPVVGARVTEISVVSGIAYLGGAVATDDKGRAGLSRLPEGEGWVIVDAEGFARASTHLVLSSGSRAIELSLDREHTLEVEVKDDLGTPLVGADIEVQGADPMPLGARTNPRGVALLKRLSAPPWIVLADADGYEALSRRGVREGERLSLVLRRLGGLRVSVTDDDGPVSATVLLAGSEIWPARKTETDAHGQIRIGSLSAGSYALRAVSGARVSPIEVGVALGRGEEKDVSLRLGPGRFVAARVVEGDEADAEPIGGARVSLVEGGLSPFPVEGMTGRDGRVRLGPISEGSATLTARADGFVPRGLVSVPESGGEVPVVLVRAGVLTGRVVDARGYPIDGANIEIIGTDAQGAPIDDDPRRAELREAQFDVALAPPRALIPSGELGVVPGPVPAIPHGFLLPPSTPGVRSLVEPWVTRADGTFRAAPASPGRVRALARHPQYVEALSDAVTLAPGGEADVRIVLRTGGAVEGRVLDARGRPAAGARVSVAAARGSLERTTLAATDGSFAFASLPESVTLTASASDAPSDLTARTTVAVAEGARVTVTLTLPEARPSLAVRVKDDRGYPVDAAQITATSVDPSLPLRQTTFTDARGDGVLSSAGGMALRLEVRAPGHATKIVRVDVGAESLEVALDLSESVRGEVRTTRGEPVAGAEVALETDVGAVHARTDRKGAYEVPDIPLGKARLVVRAEGYAPAERDVVIASSSSRVEELARVELEEGGVVSGTVVDERGDPIAGARVARDRVPTYLPVGTTPAGIAVTDARGRFRLADLAAGSVDLEAYAPDFGRGRAEGIAVQSGRPTTNLVLRLTRDSDRTQEPAASGGVAVTLGERERAVLLVDVARGSEAERAGLQRGDVLLEIDGAKVGSMADARSKLAGPIGDDVVVKVERGGGEDVLRVAREAVRK